MNKILNKTELKREIRTYKKYLEDSKKYQLIFILTSVVLVALSAVSLFFIYYDYNKNWTDIYFLISIIASAIILLFLIPISLL
jgi:membrane protein YdbS with pleckstrin-like domain